MIFRLFLALFDGYLPKRACNSKNTEGMTPKLDKTLPIELILSQKKFRCPRNCCCAAILKNNFFLGGVAITPPPIQNRVNIILIGRVKIPKRISIAAEVTERNLNSKVHKNNFKKQNLLEYCADILNLLFFYFS
mgnify:CR=1 FL=1